MNIIKNTIDIWMFLLSKGDLYGGKVIRNQKP